MKALELVVYRTWESGLDGTCYSWGPITDHATMGPINVDYFIECKRLTDAELAAEHFRAKWTGLMAEKHGNCLTDEGRAKIATVERFATLPHYDQEDQP